jgi:NADH-quinone oxidoreductase subunit L
MLLGAGMTAFYTLRMTWLVFFGEARESLHVHDAGSAMKTSLGLLAAGTLTTWLLADPFSGLFHATLPFHSIHELSTLELVEEIFSAPVTYIALMVVCLGLGIFWMVRKQAAAGKEARFDILSRESFGFDWLNRQVTSITFKFATALQVTQTGKLNWNVVGILGALLVVLVFLLWSA